MLHNCFYVTLKVKIASKLTLIDGYYITVTVWCQAVFQTTQAT